MESIEVSVIIPLYNAEQFIARVIDNLCCQTFTNIEVLIIDDASTDRSLDIACKSTESDPRIKIFQLPENSGPSKARNEGLRRALGRYILFVDADDTIEPDMIDKLVETANVTGCDLAVCDSKRMIKGKNVRNGIFLFPDEKTFFCEEIVDMLEKQLLLNQPVGSFLGAVWGKLYRRELIAKNNVTFIEHIRTFEDLAFNFTYIGNIQTIRYIRRQLYDYHIHPEVITACAREPSPLDTRQAAYCAMEALRKHGVKDEDAVMLGQHGAVSFIVKYLMMLYILFLRGKLPKSVNSGKLRKIIRLTVKDEFIHKSLTSFRPAKGENFWIPLFLKWNCIPLVAIICKLRAWWIIHGR